MNILNFLKMGFLMRLETLYAVREARGPAIKRVWETEDRQEVGNSKSSGATLGQQP